MPHGWIVARCHGKSFRKLGSGRDSNGFTFEDGPQWPGGEWAGEARALEGRAARKPQLLAKGRERWADRQSPGAVWRETQQEVWRRARRERKESKGGDSKVMPTSVCQEFGGPGTFS